MGKKKEIIKSLEAQLQYTDGILGTISRTAEDVSKANAELRADLIDLHEANEELARERDMLVKDVAGLAEELTEIGKCLTGLSARVNCVARAANHQ